uniref:Phospholipid scramblase n=1 Tax=Macrostomum lignano TaxID=282301 RepID=A0A1I8F3X7_9PLAT
EWIASERWVQLIEVRNVNPHSLDDAVWSPSGGIISRLYNEVDVGVGWRRLSVKDAFSLDLHLARAAGDIKYGAEIYAGRAVRTATAVNTANPSSAFSDTELIAVVALIHGGLNVPHTGGPRFLGSTCTVTVTVAVRCAEAGVALSRTVITRVLDGARNLTLTMKLDTDVFFRDHHRCRVQGDCRIVIVDEGHIDRDVGCRCQHWSSQGAVVHIGAVHVIVNRSAVTVGLSIASTTNSTWLYVSLSRAGVVAAVLDTTPLEEPIVNKALASAPVLNLTVEKLNVTTPSIRTVVETVAGDVSTACRTKSIKEIASLSSSDASFTVITPVEAPMVTVPVAPVVVIVSTVVVAAMFSSIVTVAVGVSALAIHGQQPHTAGWQRTWRSSGQQAPQAGHGGALDGAASREASMLPGCPRGLEYLSQLDQLIIKQKKETFEVISGFEMQNRYSVQNSTGQQVFFARESSDNCVRQCCGPQRSFELFVEDYQGNEVLRISRPYKCVCCHQVCSCANCCFDESRRQGCYIGRVVQAYGGCRPVYQIKDEADATVLVGGPIYTKCYCPGDDIPF